MPPLSFHRLQSDISALIAGMPSGARLPSEPDLAKQLGVSRATLREVMRMFETQGAVRRRQGAGTFVVGRTPMVENGLEVLESLDTIAQRAGLNVSVEDVLITRIPADSYHTSALGVLPRQPLLQISRIMRNETRPIAYLVETFSEDIVRVEELGNNFSGSLLDFLSQRDEPPTMSRTEINASAASAEVARILGIQPGDALLHLNAKLYSNPVRIIACSSIYVVPGFFNFHIVRRAGGV